VSLKFEVKHTNDELLQWLYSRGKAYYYKYPLWLLIVYKEHLSQVIITMIYDSRALDVGLFTRWWREDFATSFFLLCVTTLLKSIALIRVCGLSEGTGGIWAGVKEMILSENEAYILLFSLFAFIIWKITKISACVTKIFAQIKYCDPMEVTSLGQRRAGIPWLAKHFHRQVEQKNNIFTSFIRFRDECQ